MHPATTAGGVSSADGDGGCQRVGRAPGDAPGDYSRRCFVGRWGTAVAGGYGGRREMHPARTAGGVRRPPATSGCRRVRQAPAHASGGSTIVLCLAACEDRGFFDPERQDDPVHGSAAL